MLLDNNGIDSSGEITRHINMIYFFVVDKVNSGEVNIKYCPMYDMIKGYFNKPLQGSKFKKFREKILNIKPSNNYSTTTDGADP